jgi:hypothetical protein
MREDTQMSVIDIAINHRTSAQNEPDLHKCYINWVTQIPAFIFYKKKKKEICFIMCIDGIDHTQRTLYELFFAWQLVSIAITGYYQANYTRTRM